MLLVYFVGGEVLLYLILKVARRDFFYWPAIYSIVGLLLSFFARVLCKVIVDFTGCIHFRHPYDCGGAIYSASMLWAQIFPFVALSFYTDETGFVPIFLVCSFVSWLMLSSVFYCTIDPEHLHTFFGFKTASQFAIELFETGDEDFKKFKAAFGCRIDYTTPIHDGIKEWGASNIVRWKQEKPKWFKIKKIPEDFLPAAERGRGLRRGSSISEALMN